MENNKCYVARIGNINKIDGADRIRSADIMLNGIKQTQVVVGLDNKEGELVVYFDSNMCLSEQIMKDYPDITKYLAKAGRVKTIKLKNIISCGVIMELNKFLRYFDNDEKKMIKILKEGYSFTEINKIEICHKYTPPPARHGNGENRYKGKLKREPNRMIEGIFKFHFDTSNFLRNINKIKPDDLISISRKIHGTSMICSNSLTKRKLTLMDKILSRIGVKVEDKTYDYIYASRNTVKNARYMKDTDLNKNDLWISAGQKYFKDKLHKGETVYGEIVGYLPSGSMVQKGYDYGCKAGEYKVVVYRITMTNSDGYPVEYSWSAMKDRCKELQAPMVEEYYYGKAKDKYPEMVNILPTIEELNEFKEMIKDSLQNPNLIMTYPPYAIDEEKEIFIRSVNRKWSTKFVEQLKKDYLDKDCEDSLLSKKMPDEGIVIRREGLSIESYKLKSEKFLLQESKAKEEGIEDMEESEATNNTEEEATNEDNKR
jgi:hypothetical protein